MVARQVGTGEQLGFDARAEPLPGTMGTGRRRIAQRNLPLAPSGMNAQGPGTRAAAVPSPPLPERGGGPFPWKKSFT